MVHLDALTTKDFIWFPYETCPAGRRICTVKTEHWCPLSSAGNCEKEYIVKTSC